MSPGNYTLQGLTPFQANYSDFRVTYSANKDTSRFTYCGLAVNMDASMMANEGGLRCHECMDSSHCRRLCKRSCDVTVCSLLCWLLRLCKRSCDVTL
jgi:hypothetical protein